MVEKYGIQTETDSNITPTETLIFFYNFFFFSTRRYIGGKSKLNNRH